MSETDVFLSHDWGIDGDGRNNHSRVAIINKGLKALGYKTWFDSESMHGDVVQHMAEGIENTRAVIVFITQRYLLKVNGSNPLDNCRLEFNHSARNKTSDRMVCVVMENCMRNTLTWKGVFGMYLAGKIYVDMSGDVSDKTYLQSQLALLRAELSDMKVDPSCVASLGNEEHEEDTNEKLVAPTPEKVEDMFPIDLDRVVGDPNASSYYHVKYSADAAFRSGSKFWHSGKPHLPQSVWFEFDEPVIVTGFSFKSARHPIKVDNGLTIKDGPSKFKIFATNAKDCSDPSKYVILYEDDSGTPFTLDDKEKSGIFMNKASYRCYGVQVLDTPGRNNENREHWATISSLAFYSPEQIQYQHTFAVDIDRVMGRPNASSSISAAHSAGAAFRTGSRYWHSGKPDLPQSVWYEFNEPLIIMGFSFKSARDQVKVDNQLTINDGPSKFKIFATNADDCADASQRTILYEDNTGTPFTLDDEAKADMFVNRTRYRCYGVEVVDTPGRINKNKEHWATISSLSFYSPEQIQYKQTIAIDLSTTPGIAKATSHYSPDSSGEAAFKSGTSFWHSGTPDLPQAVWYEFQQPLAIIGYSFKSSRSEVKVKNGLTVNDGPSKFKIFATNAEDCSDVSQYVILHEDDGGIPFPVEDVQKSGMFLNDTEYRCYGLQVIDTPGRYNGEHWVNVSSLTFYIPQ